MQNKQGFTLVEMIIVIAVFGFVFGTTALTFGNLIARNSLASNGHQVVQTLREARVNATAQLHDSAWGVYFDTASSPQQYVLFRGSSYVGRLTDFDRVIRLPSAVAFQNISLQGGNEVIFDKHDGTTSEYGSFDLAFEDQTFSIVVNDLGLVDYEN